MLINGEPLDKSFVFPGGEVQVQLPEFDSYNNVITVETTIDSSDKLVEVILVAEALKHYYSCYYTILLIKYLPYARQDRRCCKGEALSGKVIVELLDSLGFSEIIIYDVHNVKLLESFTATKVTHYSMLDILSINHQTLNDIDTLVAPDKGAANKVSEIAEIFGKELIISNKTRDPNTGKITSMHLSDDDSELVAKIAGKNILILDDICDGGGTFIELSRLLKVYKPKMVTLYVTHGIFSKGLSVLFDNNIDRVFTTDSFFTWETVLLRHYGEIQYKLSNELITLKL